MRSGGLFILLIIGLGLLYFFGVKGGTSGLSLLGLNAHPGNSAKSTKAQGTSTVGKAGVDLFSRGLNAAIMAAGGAVASSSSNDAVYVNPFYRSDDQELAVTNSDAAQYLNSL